MPARAFELNEDLSFQEKFWAAERIAWAAFALLILAALFGFTGQGGVFGRAAAQNGDSSVDYPRISRLEANDDFIFRLRSQEPQAQILVDRRFLAIFDVQSVKPEPAASTAQKDGVMLTFDVAPGEPVEIAFRVRATTPALFNQARFVVNGRPISFRPTVVP